MTNYNCLTCKEKGKDVKFEKLEDATKHVQENVGHRVALDNSMDIKAPRVSVYDDKLNPEAQEVIRNLEKDESYAEIIKKGIRVEHPQE